MDTTSILADQGVPGCPRCGGKVRSMFELEYPKSLVDTTSILADQGVPGCPRCGGKVRSMFELEYPKPWWIQHLSLPRLIIKVSYSRCAPMYEKCRLLR